MSENPLGQSVLLCMYCNTVKSRGRKREYRPGAGQIVVIFTLHVMFHACAVQMLMSDLRTIQEVGAVTQVTVTQL